MRILLISLVFFYRFTLAYFLGGQCRYQLTCSSFAIKILKRKKALATTVFLITKRILMCNPMAHNKFERGYNVQ